jgi:PPP family 3-phenylpropionic acid transporter
VPAELRVTGQAAFAVIFGGFAGIIGSAGGGYFMNTFGPHAAYGGGSILAVIGGAGASASYVINKRRSRRTVVQTFGR